MLNRYDVSILKKLPLFFISIAFLGCFIVWIGSFFEVLRITSEYNIKIYSLIGLSLLTLPQVYFQITPFCAAFAVLILYHIVHTELGFLKTTGVSNFRLLRPFLIFIGFIGLFSMILGWAILPKVLLKFNDAQRKFLQNSLYVMIKENKVNTLGNAVLYVEKFDNKTSSMINFNFFKVFNNKQQREFNKNSEVLPSVSRIFLNFGTVNASLTGDLLKFDGDDAVISILDEENSLLFKTRFLNGYKQLNLRSFLKTNYIKSEGEYNLWTLFIMYCSEFSELDRSGVAIEIYYRISLMLASFFIPSLIMFCLIFAKFSRGKVLGKWRVVIIMGYYGVILFTGSNIFANFGLLVMLLILATLNVTGVMFVFMINRRFKFLRPPVAPLTY